MAQLDSKKSIKSILKGANMKSFQMRYLAHQKRKKRELLKLASKRKSERVFSGETIPDIDVLEKAIELSPSSCDRKAVRPFFVSERTDKEFLSGVLVGGVGWVQRASHIILLIADWTAYKENLDYMPYLDAGVIVQSLYFACAGVDYKCCFVNPNIRKEHRGYFRDKFNLAEDDIFCGAMIVGL